jgi:hypothetical protein
VVETLPRKALPSWRWAVWRTSDASLSCSALGLDVRLAGLCAEGEEADFGRGLERAGLGSNLDRADMEALGFYVCVADLEEELVCCVGAACVE